LPDVLGAADVLVVLLEAEAGVFSVPSKVLTSLCVGRPILAAMPTENCGARTIVSAHAGIVLDPGDPDVLVKGAQAMRDPAARARMGAAGRAYAERAFAIEPITDRFEAVLREASGGVGRRAVADGRGTSG
jgi:colanic acid biosynthesis glycosyl transferase WcaI